MSNGSSSSYVGACRKDIPYPSVSSESVPSLIDNLVTALYGEITKTVINRRVVWNIPCDPNNTAIVSPAFPRLAGEGLLCYIIRVFQAFISGGTEVFSPFLNWTFTGNGSTTTYSLPDATALLSAAYLVYIDGVVQAPVNYTIASGNPLTIVFSTAIPNGSQVVIVCMGSASKGTLDGVTINGATINTATINNLTATGTLALPVGSVTSAMIADGTIVNADINASAAIATSKLAPVTATGSTTARTLENRFADVVNVKDFGAVGDGVTNDTTAIQNAITIVGTSGGGIVYFPSGTYLSSGVSIINDAVHIIGSGKESTIVKYVGTSASAVFVFGQAVSGTGALTTVSGCSIENMSINGNRAAGNDVAGVRSTVFENFTADNVHVYDTKGGYGFAIVGTGLTPRNDLRVLNCSAERCGADGLDIKAGLQRITVNNFYTADHLVESIEENDAVGVDIRGNYVNVSNVISRNCPTVGFRVRTNVGDNITPPSDWTETKNAKVNLSNIIVYDSQQDGFQLLSPLNSVINASNIHAINCVRYGISATGGNFGSGDIYISNASATNNNVGFFVDTAKFVSVSNLTVTENSTDGVRLSENISNVSFNGLKSSANSRYGVYFLQTLANSSTTFVDSVIDSNNTGLFADATYVGNLNVTNTIIQNQSVRGVNINSASTANIFFTNGSLQNNPTNVQAIPASAKFTNVIGRVTKNSGSNTFAIDSTGLKLVSITHGLSITPTLSNVTLTLGRNTTVSDYAVDFVRLVGASSTTITAEVSVGTASATGSALANLNWFVDQS